MDATCLIDGFGPLPVVRPTHVAELGDAIRHAASASEALYPIGGRTMLALGNPPTKAGKAIDMTALNAVIDYPARDMTVTVQAGITVAKLNELLRGENQRLPIDIPFPDRATIGGAIATNVSGSRRFGFGTLRDYLIGITLIDDHGVEAKAGGRVVKNVAGYDLCKLYIGSLGTLGIVSQVTLKVKPNPEASAIVGIPVSTASLSDLLDIIDKTRTRPAMVDVLNQAAMSHIGRTEFGASDFVILVGFEENAKAVEWQLEHLKTELASHTIQSLPLETWDALRDLQLLPDAKLSFKANMVPSGVAEFVKTINASSMQPVIHAHGLSGIVHGHIDTEPSSEKWAAMQAFATKHHGNIIVTRCPAEWKSVLPVWGRTTSDRAMMKAVKEKLDPQRLFNPGRFVDGI